MENLNFLQGRSKGGKELIDKSNVVDGMSICSTCETQQQHAPRQDDIPIPSHIGDSDEVGNSLANIYIVQLGKLVRTNRSR